MGVCVWRDFTALVYLMRLTVHDYHLDERFDRRLVSHQMIPFERTSSQQPSLDVKRSIHSVSHETRKHGVWIASCFRRRRPCILCAGDLSHLTGYWMDDCSKSAYMDDVSIHVLVDQLVDLPDAVDSLVAVAHGQSGSTTRSVNQ